MRYKCIIKYELEVPCSRAQLLSEARTWEKRSGWDYRNAEDFLIADYVLTIRPKTYNNNETPEVVEVEDRG